MDLVSVDIGGTHARFAIATLGQDGSVTLGEVETMHTEHHPSFQAAWQGFRERRGSPLPPRIAMAIAGTTGREIIKFTNNPWIIRPALVKTTLEIEKLTIVNDFEAVAHAVARASEDQFDHITGPDQPLARDGTITVLGPGTGLGVAHLWRSAERYRVQATEGGHIDFAPLDAIEDAILTRLRKRYTRVSVERVVSGPAIVDIYETLAAMGNHVTGDEDDVSLWTRGMQNDDSLATAAVDRFCLSLGSVAGDYALAQGGFGGVVIAGGLGYRLRDYLPKSGFAERFCAKGRFASLMATVPVKLITHPQPGLLGAAAAFAKEHA